MFKKRFVYLMLAGLTALSLMLAACGDSTATVAPAAAPTKAAGTAAPANPAQVVADLTTLTTKLATVSTSLAQNNVTQAQAQFKDYDENWDKIEDGVKAYSAQAYKDIEDKMGAVENAIIKPATPDVEKGKLAVKDLIDTITKFAATVK